MITPEEWRRVNRQKLAFEKSHNITSGTKLLSPDNHFNRIDSDTQTFIIWDDKRHTPTAVGHLCVKVHPFSWWRLGHDVEVNLHGSENKWAPGFLKSNWILLWLRTNECLPSPQPKWPCPEGRTWSDLSRPAGYPQWTQHRSPGGWQSHSVKGEKKFTSWRAVFTLFVS